MVSQHQKICLKIKTTRAVYKGGNFHVASNIFEQLEEANIILKPGDKFNTYFAVWDTECMLIKMESTDINQPKNNCLQYEAECKLVSVAVSSNIPPYNRPVFFRHHTTQSDLMAEVIGYFSSIAETMSLIQHTKLEHLFSQLKDKQNQYQLQIDNTQSVDVAGFYRYQLKQTEKLTDKLEKHTQKLVLFSFNGAR